MEDVWKEELTTFDVGEMKSDRDGERKNHYSAQV